MKKNSDWLGWNTSYRFSSRYRVVFRKYTSRSHSAHRREDAASVMNTCSCSTIPRTHDSLLLLHVDELAHAHQRRVVLLEIFPALQLLLLHHELLDVSRVGALPQLLLSHAHYPSEQSRVVVSEHREKELLGILVQFLELLHPVLAVEETLLVFFELKRLADARLGAHAVRPGERAGSHLKLYFTWV